MGTWDSLGTPKSSEFDCKGQKPCIGALFISLKSYRSVDVENGLAWAIWTYAALVVVKRKGRESNWQFDSRRLLESTRPRCVQVEWGTPLKSSRWELQLCFRHRSDPRSKQRVIVLQSYGSRNLSSFRTPPWDSCDKKPFDVGAVWRHKEYYMGEGGGFPWVWAMVSLMNAELPAACFSTKGVPASDLPNLLVGLM
jgi:hypothetical protein